jgi:choline-sulfatase
VKKQPNLLLIMCDQLRADVLGCYGNSVIRTPNIDRLAERGICFDRGYSLTPVCIPARHSLIAGQKAFKLGMLQNTHHRHPIMDPLPQRIREAGYFTCAVGKMHFVPTREHFGFDRMLLSEEIPAHIQDDDYLLYLQEQGYSQITEPHGKRSQYYYVPQTSLLPEDIHTTTWTANTASRIIEKNRDRPFFLFTSFIKPQPPFDPCPPYASIYTIDDIPEPQSRETDLHPVDRIIAYQNSYKVNGIQNTTEKQIKEIRAAYYGCVTQIDTHRAHRNHWDNLCRYLD